MRTVQALPGWLTKQLDRCTVARAAVKLQAETVRDRSCISFTNRTLQQRSSLVIGENPGQGARILLGVKVPCPGFTNKERVYTSLGSLPTKKGVFETSTISSLFHHVRSSVCDLCSASNRDASGNIVKQLKLSRQDANAPAVCLRSVLLPLSIYLPNWCPQPPESSRCQQSADGASEAKLQKQNFKRKTSKAKLQRLGRLGPELYV